MFETDFDFFLDFKFNFKPRSLMKYLLFLVAKPMKADMTIKLQSKESVIEASLKCKSFKERKWPYLARGIMFLKRLSHSSSMKVILQNYYFENNLR